MAAKPSDRWHVLLDIKNLDANETALEDLINTRSREPEPTSDLGKRRTLLTHPDQPTAALGDRPNRRQPQALKRIPRAQRRVRERLRDVGNRLGADVRDSPQPLLRHRPRRANRGHTRASQRVQPPTAKHRAHERLLIDLRPLVHHPIIADPDSGDHTATTAPVHDLIRFFRTSSARRSGRRDRNTEDMSTTSNPSRQRKAQLKPQIIRTLLDWYRAGVDVQARLPRLSTYMGHYAGDRVKGDTGDGVVRAAGACWRWVRKCGGSRSRRVDRRASRATRRATCRPREAHWKTQLQA